MRNLTFEEWAFTMIALLLIREGGASWLGFDVVMWLTSIAFLALAVERFVNLRRSLKARNR